jgi:hypothetical protein
MEYVGYRINDDGSEGPGNSNTIAQPGETILLSVIFKNTDIAPTTAITARLSCSDPDITIVNSQLDLSPAPAGSWIIARFKFTVSHYCTEKAIDFTALFTTASDGFEKTFKVNVAKITTRYIGTAGTLSTLLTDEEKATLKSISLNGKMDSRDFSLLNYEMPALEIVDLQHITIVEYNSSAEVKAEETRNLRHPDYDNIATGEPDRKPVAGGTRLSNPANQLPSACFANNKKLKIVVLPNSLTAVSVGAFINCEQLISIKLPVLVNKVDLWAFRNCISLTEIIADPNSDYFSTQNGVLFNKEGTSLILFPHGQKGHYTIPSTVTSIGSSAFDSHFQLESITIPNSVTTTESYAFYNCTALQSVQFPASLKSVGNYAFAYCSAIDGVIHIPSTLSSIGESAFACTASSFVVEEANPAYAAIDGVLFSKDKTHLFQFPFYRTGSYTIPASTYAIGTSAFLNCTGLTNITIPASVNLIQHFAFFGCEGLTSLISERATPVDLSSSGEDVFKKVDKARCTLYVPAGSVDLYRAAYLWGDFTNIIESGVVIRTVQVETPGTLSTYFSDTDAETLTSLKVTGTICQPDFVFMRDRMPALAELDLSEATIAPYSSILEVRPRPVDRVITPSGDELREPTEPDRPQRAAAAIYYPANEIPPYAFYTKTTLKQINLPESTSSIGDYAFESCSSLTTIVLPAGVNTIGYRAFVDCTGMTRIGVDEANPYFRAIDGLLFNKEASLLIQCPGAKTGPYTVPSTVTRIGPWSFGACRKISDITFPESVTSIGQNAFWNCNGLKSLSVPASVTTIEPYAFAFCFFIVDDINLSGSLDTIGTNAFSGTGVRINVDPTNQNYASLDGVLFNKDFTILMTCPGKRPGPSYTIPPTVVALDSRAFEYCRYLTTINIPESVTSIGSYALLYCYALTEINVADTNGSFSSDDGVLFNKNATHLLQYPGGLPGSYRIPATVTTLGSSSFEACSKLTGITIPETVSSYGHYAFYGCTGLSSVYSARSTPVDLSSSYGVFININMNTCTLYVPKGSIELYRSAVQWNSFKNIESIGSADLKTVHVTTAGTLESLLTAVEKETTTKLKLTGTINYRDFVTLRDALPVLAEVDLSEVSIAEFSGDVVPAYAARRIRSNEPTNKMEKQRDDRGSNRIAGSATRLFRANEIPESAFEFKETLTTVHLPQSLSSINVFAFRYTGLKSVNIPVGVSFIGLEAFLYCDSLTQFTVDNNNAAYSAHDGVLFTKDATTLVQFPGARTGSYTIPGSVTTIGVSAFDGCHWLTDVTIPASVTYIANYAFWNCIRLNTVSIPNSVISIGNNAFAYCFGMTGTLNIPPSVTNIGTNAFLGICHEFVVDINNPSYASFDGVLYTIDGTKLLQCPGKKEGWYTLHPSTTSIEERAFHYSNRITGVTIPATVNSIHIYAFQECESMSEYRVEAGSAWFSSHDGVLYNADATAVVRCPQTRKGACILPATTTTIGWMAFGWCTSLSSVTLPATVESIQSYAFYFCASLTSIYSERPVPVDLNPAYSVFYNVNTAECTLYVPTAGVELYKAAHQWNEFVHIIGTNTSTPVLPDNTLQLLPNPANSYFSIGGFEGIATLTLTDLNGRIVLSKVVVDNEHIAVDELAAGVYFAAVRTGEGVMVKKLVKR